MKISRFTAKDMRQALRKVRDQLGPEAVILTSKRGPSGVEVTAAIDFDAARLEAQAAAEAPVAFASASAMPAALGQPRKFEPEEFVTTPPPGRDEFADDEDVELSPFARLQAEMLQANPMRRVAEQQPQQSAVASPARGRGGEIGAVQSATPARAGKEKETALSVSSLSISNEELFGSEEEGAVDDVHAALESAIDSAFDSASSSSSMAAGSARSGTASHSAIATRKNQNPSSAKAEDNDEESALSLELKAMRRILETQMAQLAWNDLSRRAPIHTEVLRELTEVGLTQEFAAQIVAQLPVGMDMIKARRLSISLIAQRLNVIGDRWLDNGGHIALVGPTGVGKTTALAKLAVRWVLRHGPRSLALISADGVRIGAHDQIQALGQMLDVPVLIAESFDEIPKIMGELSQRLVLIDTPGMSQRDPQLADRMAQLAEAKVETALVLSASTQAGAIAETVARFSTAKVASVLLTKVDEAASLGGILSVLARSELPISYVSEGQRVPEDLRPARALELVSSAVQLAKASGAAADEDLLRRRYGEVAHALA